MVKKVGVNRILAISFIAICTLAVSFAILGQSMFSSSDDSTVLKYHALVCVYKNGQLINCSHNVLFDNGKNMTRDILGNGGTMGAVTNITLCNASTTCGTPVAVATEGFTAYTNCGLNSQSGTYATLQNAPGNWTITKTFTSTCDNVNTTVTRLTNATGGIFSGNSFTVVTLQTNDQLTINWTLMIS